MYFSLSIRMKHKLIRFRFESILYLLFGFTVANQLSIPQTSNNNNCIVESAANSTECACGKQRSGE